MAEPKKKAIFFVGEKEILIVLPDGEVRSGDDSNKAQLKAWLYGRYPNAEQVFSREEISQIANERYELSYPELVEH